LLAVVESPLDRSLFEDRTLAALDYADAMTLGNAVDGTTEFVRDDVFASVQANYSTQEIVVLTELIAWENASARFNCALGVEAQGLWRRSG